MTIRRSWLSALLGLFAASGCTDAVPTSGDQGRFPVEAETVELRLPFAAFGADFQVFGGYSSQFLLPGSAVAEQWGGDVDMNAMVRFGALPRSIFVLPPGSVTTVSDTAYVPIGGQVLVRMDTTEVFGSAPFPLEIGTVSFAWDPPSTNWDFAVDTLGNRVPWPEPGGGPAPSVGSGSWNPQMDGDSMLFNVDSATVNRWTDTGRLDRGLRISGGGAGSHLRIANVELIVQARSSVNPDTIVDVSPVSRQLTVLYTPRPELSEEAFQIGGAPARRATFRLTIPSVIEEDTELCASVPCPLALLPDRLVYAALELHSRETVPIGFQPRDTIAVELRPALSPERLPRSPLGTAVQAAPRFLFPEMFSTEPGTRFEIPMTRYVRDLLRSAEPGAAPVPSTLALLTGFEPWSLEYATFWGPGTELEPTLRLILTLSDGVGLP